jgi:outer membrane protein assembly factor BamB
VYADNTLFIATGTRIYAVDAGTGSLKWRYPTDTTLTSPILATPSVSDGAVYFGTGDGLYALDVANGKQKWPHYNARQGAVTTPIPVGDTIYFGGGDQKLYAISAATGEPKTSIWGSNRRAGREVGGDFAGNIVFSNDTFFFVTGDQVLRAVSASSATLRWAQRLTAVSASVTPTLSGDNVYVSVGDTVLGFRALNGQARLSVNIGNESLVPPAVDADGNIYAINADLAVVSFGQRGRPNWKQLPRLEHEPLAAPAVEDGTLFIGTALGGVYSIDAKTGEIKWRYVIQPSATDNARIPTTTSVSAAPVLAKNMLYVASDDGAVTAFSSAKSDGMPPIVTVEEPKQGDYLSGRPPFQITAKVIDEGSGVDLASVQLMLDGQPIARRPSARIFSEKPGFSYDPDTGLLEYLILDTDTGQRTTLADGHHKLTIVAKDWLGNTINKEWSFYVDDTIRPKPRKSQSNTTRNGRGGRGGGGLKGGGGGNGGNGNQ